MKPDLAKTVGLGIYGPTGRKIAELLHKSMYSYNAELRSRYGVYITPTEHIFDNDATYRAYWVWHFSKPAVTTASEFTLDFYFRGPHSGRAWYPGRYTIFAGRIDESLARWAFAKIADEFVAQATSAGKSDGDVVQLYGTTDSIIYQARLRDLKCFAERMRGAGDEDLKKIYGEKCVKNVVGQMADPLKVELRGAAIEEEKRMQDEANAKCHEITRSYGSQFDDLYRKQQAEKHDERAVYYAKLDAIDEKYQKLRGDIEAKRLAEIEAVKKASKEAIKAMKKELR